VGKSAIDAPRREYFLLDPNDVVLVTNPKHGLYDKRVKQAVDMDMVKNVAMQGIHTPIDVVKEVVGEIPPVDGMEKGKEVLVVVKGRQRTRWARAANEILSKSGCELLRLPVILKKLPQDSLLGITLSENSVRVEETPLQKAEKVSRYIEMGHTEKEASIICGVSETCIRQWLTCLNLSAGVRKAIEDGTIAASAASKLASLSTEEQDASLSELTADGGKPTGKRAQQKAAGKKGQRDHVAPGKKRIKSILSCINNDFINDKFKDDNILQLMLVLSWAIGEQTDDEIAKECLVLKRAFVMEKNNGE
jgi:ParB family chromosome partitioning protein